MALVTVQILEGHERGQIFSQLETPITIGREEDNHIRLNDDSVSRFHAKVQESDGHIILTDLQSTNGTRVNGFPAQLRVLQEGDQIWIGRCLLVFGEERPTDFTHTDESLGESGNQQTQAELKPVQFEDNLINRGAEQLFPAGPPNLPHELSAAQKATLSDMMAYFHAGLASISQSAFELNTDVSTEDSVLTNIAPDDLNHGDQEGTATVKGMFVQQSDWKNLLSLEMTLAKYLKNIADPDAQG